MGLLTRLSGLIHGYEPEPTEDVDHDTVVMFQRGKLVEITADKEGEGDGAEVRKQQQ